MTPAIPPANGSHPGAAGTASATVGVTEFTPRLLSLPDRTSRAPTDEGEPKGFP